MTNRQARIKRLKEAFQKAEELMNEGYVVQWDGEVVDDISFSEDSLLVETNCENYVSRSVIYQGFIDRSDYADLTTDEIEKVLAERLTVWKKVEVKV